MKTTALLILLFLAAGCAATGYSNVLELKDRGRFATYEIAERRAWTISRQILRKWGAALEDSDQQSGWLTAHLSQEGQAADGVRIAVWHEATEEGRTKVTIVTRRGNLLTAWKPLTEQGFHEEFKEAVKLLEERFPDEVR
ncbi:MAG: hypothetical protein ACYTG4_03260 [Planctomycetota bacterium]|jgi:hypothetical protein